MRGNLGLRAGALLGVGAIALHQGDYWLGGAGDGSLGGHDHGYLPLVVALATVGLLLACAGLARTLWRASRGQFDDPAPPAFQGLWLTASVALLAIFSLQEWIESRIAPGHASGPAHVAEHVGWTGVVLAILLGALIALLLRGAHSATRLVAQRHASLRPLRPAAGRGLPLADPELPRLDVLAAHRAGRAPPGSPALS